MNQRHLNFPKLQVSRFSFLTTRVTKNSLEKCLMFWFSIVIDDINCISQLEMNKEDRTARVLLLLFSRQFSKIETCPRLISHRKTNFRKVIVQSQYPRPIMDVIQVPLVDLSKYNF